MNIKEYTRQQGSTDAIGLRGAILTGLPRAPTACCAKSRTIRGVLGFAALMLVGCHDSALLKAAGGVGTALNLSAVSLKPVSTRTFDACENTTTAIFIDHMILGTTLGSGTAQSSADLCVLIERSDVAVQYSLLGISHYGRALGSLANGNSGAEDLRQAASQFGDAASASVDIVKTSSIASFPVWKDAFKLIGDSLPALAHVFIAHQAKGNLCEVLIKDDADVTALLLGLKSYLQASSDEVAHLAEALKTLRSDAENDSFVHDKLPQALVLDEYGQQFARIHGARVERRAETLKALSLTLDEVIAAHQALSAACAYKNEVASLREATRRSGRAIDQLSRIVLQ